MKAAISNVNGHLFAIPMVKVKKKWKRIGKEYRMLHSYIREPIFAKSKSPWATNEELDIVGERRVGCVVAIDVDGEIYYGWSKVKPPDQFNPKKGLEIAAGKTLTRPMVGPEEFEDVEFQGHPEAYDELLNIYNRAQRYLRPLLHD